MSERLPIHVDPVKFADRGRSMTGALPISACRRLLEWLESDAGDLTVELQFGLDQSGRRILTGRVTGTLRLTCQRCLHGFDLDLDLPVGLVLVESEAEAEMLPDEIDALVVGERASMHTVDMLEDDLILALPLIPKCPDTGMCTPAAELFDSEQLQGQDKGAWRPFSDLDDPSDHEHK